MGSDLDHLEKGKIETSCFSKCQWQCRESNFDLLGPGQKRAVIFNHNLPQLQVYGKDKDNGCEDDEEDGEASKGDGDGQDGLVEGAEGGG